jgi:hypothetical protein
VTCTTDEACDMLNYFRSAADALTAIGDPEGPFCSRAPDNLQSALRSPGSPVLAIEQGKSLSRTEGPNVNSPSPRVGHGARAVYWRSSMLVHLMV